MATMPACPHINLLAFDATDYRGKTFRIICSELECLTRAPFLLEGFPLRESGSHNAKCGPKITAVHQRVKAVQRLICKLIFWHFEHGTLSLHRMAKTCTAKTCTAGWNFVFGGSYTSERSIGTGPAIAL